MKCPNCEYEYEWDWVDGIQEKIKGDDAFLYPSFSNDISLSHPDKYNQKNDLELVMCPKCGILFVTNILEYIK